MRVSPMTPKLAALLFAVAALAPLSSWWLLLFSENPPKMSPIDAAMSQLTSTFSLANEQLWWFVGWATVTVYLLVVAAFYVSPLVRRRPWAIAVATSAGIVTLYSLVFTPVLGLFLLLPLVLSIWWAHGA